MSSQCHRHMQRFHKQMHPRNDQSRPQRFPVLCHARNSGLSLGFVKLKAMFKQHMNLMI